MLTHAPLGSFASIALVSVCCLKKQEGHSGCTLLLVWCGGAPPRLPSTWCRLQLGVLLVEKPLDACGCTQHTFVGTVKKVTP